MKCRLQFSRRRPAPRRATQGFTLIEIMIVIDIIGMVLALGMPHFIRSMQKDPLRQAVSDPRPTRNLMGTYLSDRLRRRKDGDG